MNKDGAIGLAKQVIGSLKQVVGNAVGDTKLEVDGMGRRDHCQVRTGGTQ